MPTFTPYGQGCHVADFPCSGAFFRSKSNTGACMTLRDLMMPCADPACLSETAVFGLQLDSRKVRPGDAFFALAGSRQHGLLHASEAIDRGAVAIGYDPAAGGGELAAGLNNGKRPAIVAIPGLDQKLGWIADRFFGSPSAHMDIIGITGTNGKTSCSHFLARALAGTAACAVMGTLGWGFMGALRASANTTPDAIAIQTALAKLRAQGAKTVAMEVSSHGQVQGRTGGIRFKGAVYTNISRDHLDYHGTMDAYLLAKLSLLQAPGLAFAVVNLDDDHAQRILSAVPSGVEVLGYSRRCEHRAPVETVCAEKICAENVRHNVDGVAFDLCHRDEKVHLSAPVLGDFNVENVLATAAVLLKMGMPLAQAAQRLALIQAVPGRMQRFGVGSDAPTVIVDYAHTPDALKRLLDSVRMHCSGTLWLVFGCGGERDRGKRAQMGRIAQQGADRVVMTDDNPRHEDGGGIIEEILTGCVDAADVTVMRDRTEATHTAIAQAVSGDIVVVAGKGHEDYQEINGVRHPFSDAKVVRAALSKRRSDRVEINNDDAAK